MALKTHSDCCDETTCGQVVGKSGRMETSQETNVIIQREQGMALGRNDGGGETGVRLLCFEGHVDRACFLIWCVKERIKEVKGESQVFGQTNWKDGTNIY